MVASIVHVGRCCKPIKGDGESHIFVDGETYPGIIKVTLEPEEALHLTGRDAYTPPSTPDNFFAQLLHLSSQSNRTFEVITVTLVIPSMTTKALAKKRV